MKYIEYDIAERYLHEACRYIGSNGGLMLKCEFKEEPTIEIVRCKDCEYHFYDVGNQAWFCHEHEYGEIFNDDDFCSWAKMKGGAE